MKVLQNKRSIDELYETIRSLYNEKKYREVLELFKDIDIEKLPEEHRWAFFEAKGMSEINTGCIAEGIENLRRALFSPLGMPLLSQRRIASNYYINMHYVDGISDREMYEAHSLYNRLFPKNEHFVPYKLHNQLIVYSTQLHY